MLFLNGPMLRQMVEEMQNIGEVTKNRPTLHQNLNKARQTIQISRVIQLVAKFDNLGLSMAVNGRKG